MSTDGRTGSPTHLPLNWPHLRLGSLDSLGKETNVVKRLLKRGRNSVGVTQHTLIQLGGKYVG